MRFVLRVLFLPLVVLCYVIMWLALLTIKCGSYILSPVLWFIGVCCIFTIIRQQWNQTLLLLIIGSAGALLFVIVVAVAVIAQEIAIVLRKM